MLFRSLHSLFFYFLTGVSFIAGIIILLIFFPFARSKSKLFQTAAHLWTRFLALFSGIPVKVSGLENIPRDKAVLFAANHQGFADIVAVLAYLPVGFRFVIKKELFKIPVFAWVLKNAGYLSVERRSILSSHHIAIKIADIIKNGESVLIFPEGTRTKTGKLGQFRRGSLVPALKSKAPIIPIAISGSFNILPPGSWILNPHPVKLSLGKPLYIESEADYNKKLEKVRNAITQML